MAFDEKNTIFLDTEMVPPSSGGAIESEIPDPPTELSEREKKVWLHVTQALKSYQLVHLTDGIVLTIIVKTFAEWLDANEALEDLKKKNVQNPGTYITRTPNGYEQPHPLYYIARDKKKELLNWLPEAALTIPSFVKAKIQRVEETIQGKLFEDPVQEYMSTRPPSYNSNLQ